MEVLKDSIPKFKRNYVDANKIEPIVQDINKEQLNNLVDTTLLQSFVENISDRIENPNCSSVSSNEIKTSETSSDILCSKNIVDHISMNGDSSPLTDSCNVMNSEDNDGSSKLTGFESNKDSLSENSGYMTFDTVFDENSEKYSDEEFQDAVNFFNDPSVLDFLENASRKNIPSNPSEVRSSLYTKFDPLYAKYFSQQDVPSNELPINMKDDTHDEKDQTSNNSALNNVENKDFNNPNFRQFRRNVLILLDTPKKDDSISHYGKVTVSDSEKLFTKDDLRRALENKELEMRGNFMRKEKALEELFSKKVEELETKLQKQKAVSYALYTVVKEAMHLNNAIPENKQLLTVQLSNADLNKLELNDFVDTSENNLQNKKFTLLDLFKEIDQNKNVFENIKNENIMKQLENMNAQLNDQEKIPKEECKSLEEMK